jgi:toxin CptA
VIGVAFVLMLLLVGAWSYTDLLADLAQAMAQAGTAQHLGVRVAIGVALLCGALAGGWMTGQLRRPRLTVMALARCFVGGVLMGWGGLLTPGGNDTLVLVALPLLWPYAWVAFATLCGTIAAARWGATGLSRAQRRFAG